MQEFDLINAFFAPLARGFPGSLNLTDDAALVRIPEGQELVITKDAISEGVHFLGSEDPALIARKLLRVNLSDLAAKGAKPLAYLLALMLPKAPPPILSPANGGGLGWGQWVKQFADGLHQDQAEFDIHLIGGDTIGTRSDTASFSLTALGVVTTGTMLKRDAAKPGDLIVVSGTLGDAALGLRLLSPPPVGGRAREGVSGKISARLPPPQPSPPRGEGDFLIQRYFLPQPRIELGLKLPGIANACMDISDGLVQDMGHICKASNVGAVIESDKLPLSDAAHTCIKAQPDLIMVALTGGDDYELLFTVRPDKAGAIPEGCTVIGRITEGNDVTILDVKRKVISIQNKGFMHFHE